MSEYDPVYQTPCFSNASPKLFCILDALHIGLCMLHNSAPPPASTPLHVPPPLVCLFVYLCHWCRWDNNPPHESFVESSSRARRSYHNCPKSHLYSIM